MTQPSLIDNIHGDVRTMLALLDDIERAATPEEQATAGLALETECALQTAAMLEWARVRARPDMARR